MALVERYHTQDAKAPTNVETHEPRQAADRNANVGRVARKAVSLIQSEERAKHVGVLALEVYFPGIYVCSLSLHCMYSTVMPVRSLQDLEMALIRQSKQGKPCRC